MNIFITSKCPEKAARNCCDQHIIKMPVESLQMCSVAQHETGGWFVGLYSPSHVNHPCNIWVRQAQMNYKWLLRFVKACQYEYRYRFGDKPRKVDDVYKIVPKSVSVSLIDRTPFVAAISKPDKVWELWTWADAYEKGIVTITKSYREFYIQDKSRWARWTKRRPPKWYINGLEYYGLMHRLRYRAHNKISWADAELDLDHYPEATDDFNYVAAY
ncbi:hypothetical protein GR7B_00202 [Vibrio phage vB_VcorM_GR7B]|nr:hypothetical protein GR7B_00202 [Vibrio phage vB_VcorM_GR7B]